ncbi:hypothetical protein [Niveibacterium sp. COAC-50]|uniref:hypothetical protein n=1 Tax=Niveibacterium sp. COAC-50 TaxID=2729384 RepID=UPI001552C1B0|nr:hypothetical protein [Niveibacterium sp. COAC-50]
MKSLSIGDLIVDNFGREGIVYSKERRPSAKWLAEQEDSRVKQSPGPWWRVLPLDGGAAIVPAELGTFVRRASIDDLLKLVLAQQSEHAGTVTLLELFKALSKQAAPGVGRDA